MKAWAWVVAHPGELWTRRHRMQRGRRVGDRDLLSGGPLPLAPGSVRQRGLTAGARWASGALDGYWRLVRRWIP